MPQIDYIFPHRFDQFLIVCKTNLFLSLNLLVIAAFELALVPSFDDLFDLLDVGGTISLSLIIEPTFFLIGSVNVTDLRTFSFASFFAFWIIWSMVYFG